jgi:glycosyltransferase involved in cell wall biosynthesis
MKIGIAVPCYHGHINKLYELLDSIENQTRLPNKVVVSSSSTKKIDIIKKYRFDLAVIVMEEKKNAAQNRNIAAAQLNDMDYITFIDADDIMHPQRIEVLLDTFQKYDSDIILHNFSMNRVNDTQIFDKIQNINARSNSLMKGWSGCIVHNYSHGCDDRLDKIHHGHATVKKEIFDKVKFPEEPEFHTKEDCVFCYRVFSLPDVKNAYIQNELSYYKPSNTGGIS